MTFASPKKSVAMMTEAEKKAIISNLASFIEGKIVPEAEIREIANRNNWEFDLTLTELLD